MAGVSCCSPHTMYMPHHTIRELRVTPPPLFVMFTGASAGGGYYVWNLIDHTHFSHTTPIHDKGLGGTRKSGIGRTIHDLV